ncbi:MAG: lysophospholipid acyltransferase family protein [Candidatus Omnitrophota bacterium]|nr:lysophospholipid acyltransferase family protein [Candidatus Omnitrophota bacterium]
MIFYILYRIGYFVANTLPLKLAYSLAKRVSDIQYAVSKRDRNAVAQNLGIITKKNAEESQKLARKVFRNFGLYLVDFFRMQNLSKEEMERRVKVEGLEIIDGVLKQNRGGIILTCHIGNWEMGGVTMAMLGYDISAVALNHRHKNINDFFIKQREDKGLKVIPIDHSMKRCVSVLRRKGLLALAGDRDFTDSGVVMDFFGIPTSIPKGPAMFALKTNSPIIPGMFIRQDSFNYKLIFSAPIEVKETPGVDKDEIIKQASYKFVAVMEKYIRLYPEQWLIFRRFWDAPVDEMAI